ncbi:MAG: hypothetical protein IJR18_03170 [Campylobacter sp.]|nr:hypothetical protein [Campylobacter sp.]
MKKFIVFFIFFINFVFADTNIVSRFIKSLDSANCKDYQCVLDAFDCKKQKDCEERKQDWQEAVDALSELNTSSLDIDDKDKAIVELMKSFITKDLSNLKILLDKNPNLINQDEMTLFDVLTDMMVTEIWGTQSYSKEHFYNVLNLLLSYKPDLNYKAKDSNSTLFNSLIILPIENEDRIKISDMLLNSGLDIKKQSMVRGISTLYVALISDNFEMFSYYLKNGVFEDKMLFYCVIDPMYKYIDELSLYNNNGIDKNYEKLIISPEFKQAQKDGIKYLEEYLKYRKLKDESVESLIATTKYLALSNNVEAIKLLVDNGILENERAKSIFITYATMYGDFTKNYNKKEILDLVDKK